jgi:TonB family protein
MKELKRAAIILLAAIIGTVSLRSLRAENDQPVAQVQGIVVDLCAALAAVGPGDRLPVIVHGVFWVGPEHQALYDLANPECDFDTQPLTWVEFDRSYKEPPGLAKLIKKDQRARVTFIGELWGPARHPPDDLSLPPAISYRNRAGSPGRYGHHFKFRTQLVVFEASNIQALPEGAPWPPRSFALPRSPFPVVSRAEIPTAYPERAAYLGISGDVVVEVELKIGNVVSTKVVSGDRLLVQETLDVIGTWKFDPSAQATFTTTFSYRFEDNLPSTTASVRVHTELPVKVEIVAPRSNW